MEIVLRRACHAINLAERQAPLRVDQPGYLGSDKNSSLDVMIGRNLR
jgi:hypothetical protein